MLNPIRRLILTVKRRTNNLSDVICPQQASVAALLVDRGEEFGGHTATGAAMILRSISSSLLAGGPLVG